ncbi:DUF7344 domain-containing protein [Halorarum halobium]|uniref:DUF7344 domain-containing protein n=1 Tax=Halorarum halobium TaxID=3075121 RepID=UPI0028AB1663|nr:hypothetical protein [Halobaculum sp. XH14]
MVALSEESRAFDVAPETAFEVLADDRRRAVLSVLRDSAETCVPVAELVDDVAAMRSEHGRCDRERVAVRFHHATLPKLADSGVIEHDSGEGTVRYRAHPFVDACLDLLAEHGAGTGTN